MISQAPAFVTLLALISTFVAAIDDTTIVHEDPVLELYMHDVLRGSNPTASGRVPFARPMRFLPPKGDVIPSASSTISTVNTNGVSLGTGFAGTTFAGNSNGPRTEDQLRPNGLGLGFGTITVIDDLLMSGPGLGSQPIGKAQGLYVTSSADGTTQMLAFSAVIKGGEHGDSLNFFGVYKIGSTISRLSVTGGTGKFKNVRGFAEIQPLVPSGQHVADGPEALLRITVHLIY